MNPLQAAKDIYKQYATFHGRATRRQYWSWFLFQAIVFVGWFIVEVICLIGLTADLAQRGQSGSWDSSVWISSGFWGASFTALLLLYSLFVAASIVPDLAAEARRLHDANFSAWWLLLWLIPITRVGLLIMLCFPTHAGPSRFANEGSWETKSTTDPWASSNFDNNSSSW
jgi:hypothetical protein